MIARNLLLLIVFLQSLVMAAESHNDFIALRSLKDMWQNTPPNWVGADPCDNWDGIKCIDSRVTSITLASINLTGQLSGDLEVLSELQILDLSYNKGLTGSIPRSIGSLRKLTTLILIGCGFSGTIPDTVGLLQNLISLDLNSNSFSGAIPPSIGNLSSLYWLDLANNQLDGPIPVSNGSTPGIDMLLDAKHFHLGQNKLSGTIPDKLFSSNMVLIHVLLDNNKLTGSIPSSLGLVQTLEVVRLDRNSLSGVVPSNLNNLINVHELFLSNNRLTGPMPNLTGMDHLTYVDVSNNSFDESAIPSWFSALESLTTLAMEHTQRQGEVPPSLFELPNLETLLLKNNQLNGTLDIGDSSIDQLHLVDLQTNFVTDFAQMSGGYNATIVLVGNPVCQAGKASYCTISKSNASYDTPPDNCLPVVCSSSQISSPNCKCAYPYTGTLVFRAPSFSDLGNPSYYIDLETTLTQFFSKNSQPVDSISLSNPTKDSAEYLRLNLKVFPYGQDHFNRTAISGIGLVFSNQIYKPPKSFGPFFFIGDNYANFAESQTTGSHKRLSLGIIIGAAAGGSILLLLFVFTGVYAFRQKRRAEKAIGQNSFGDPNKSSGSIPRLKGARWFSFDELKKYTDNFSEVSDIGAGGYGKVYRGTLPSGQLVAIKRSQQGSMQGALEFKTEIELLSRVHHKNVVSLLGFCFEQGEQILVYEYVPNGTLDESLSGKSGVRLDWTRRLKVALGVARGLAYLHELADPPIIHRDIKSTNILLDEHLNAKVADFGLSKPMLDSGKDHVSTQVKGTMGYLDPEYYMTQQLTEKSDVYSFGVLLLELLTARRPIVSGQYIVRIVSTQIDRTRDLYNLHEILDPAIGLGTVLKGLEKLVDMAMRCVEELGENRPIMSEVVKEIEGIMQLADLNPNAESASSSASYEKPGKANFEDLYSKDVFEYSGGYLPSKVDPQ